MTRFLSILLVLAGLAPAQVLVVDAANGPGTSFTSIADATANAPDGAVLRVRAGTYTGFRIVDKSLTVIADPGVLVQGDLSQFPPIEVVDLEGSGFVSLRGLRFSFLLSGIAISCRDSGGTILIDDCAADPTGSFGFGRLRATNCDRVFVRDSTFRVSGLFDSALEAFASNVAMIDSTLTAQGICVRVGGGRVELSRCTLESSPTLLATPVLFLSNGHLGLNGNTDVTSLAPGTAPLADGNGTLVLDPSVQISQGTGPVIGTVTVESRRVPFVNASTDALGGQAQGELRLAPGETGALLVGFPTAPLPFPGVTDPIWLDSGVVQAFGSAATVTGSYQVPNAPFVIGVQIAWQGVATDASAAVRVSNPVAYVHR